MKAQSTPPKRAAGRMAAALSAILLAVVWIPQAAAYVLEGPHILELTAQAMGRLNSLKVEQKLLLYPQTPDDTPTALDETAFYVMPRRFRSDIASDRIDRTHLEVADQFLTVIDGRASTAPDPFDLYQRLLRSRTRLQLMQTLNALGVETAITSLGRVDQTVVFVLGARYPDESVSQLAVDKENFLPVRLLLAGGRQADPGQRLEIVYHGWQKIQDGWFPAQVVFFMNGKLAREIRAVQIQVNPSIPTGLMDLDALKASVAATGADALLEQKQEAVDAVRQGVQEFQKKFE